MVKEVEWQRRIIKCTTNEGGMGRKWSSAYQVGVPDLVLALPTIGTILTEVKLLHVSSLNFKRDLGITPKQKDTLKRFQVGGSFVFVSTVVVLKGGGTWLVGTPWEVGRLLGEECGFAGWDEAVKFPVVPWIPGKGFNMDMFVHDMKRHLA
jgi:hypothetical protein